MYLITCEHGGNEVPTAFARLFRGHRRLLATHRGYDAGAWSLPGRFLVGSTLPWSIRPRPGCWST